MRKVVRSVLVYAVLGALLTYAIACVCAAGYFVLWGPYQERVLDEIPGVTDRYTRRRTGLSRVVENNGFGVTERLQQWTQTTAPGIAYSAKQQPQAFQRMVYAGLPLHATACTERVDSDRELRRTVIHTDGIFLGAERSKTGAVFVLPLAPRWIGFTVDTAFWAGCLAAASALTRRVRADLRARRDPSSNGQLIDYSRMVQRALPSVLAVMAVATSWLGMQAIHELGHVLSALGTGAAVNAIHLHPFEISSTDTTGGQSQLLVVWCGPIIGSVVPCVMFGIAAWLRSRDAFLFRFFAAFCLLANGAYIGIGAWDKVGDAGDMLRLGSPFWLLETFGAVAMLASAVLFRGLAAPFGFARDRQPVRTASLVGLAVMFALLSVTGWWLLP